jgi:hypothetical protein
VKRASVRAALVLAGALFAPGAAFAQEDAGAPAVARREVEVAIAGDEKPRAAVETVLRERVSGLKLSPSFRAIDAVASRDVLATTATTDDRLARVWIDLSDREKVALYVVDEVKERVLVRTIVRNANPEVTWEELGLIVGVTLEALAAGQLIGITRDAAREELLPPPPPVPIAPAPAPPPPDRPAPPPPIRATWKPAGGLGYVGEVPGGGLGLTSAVALLLELLRWKGAVGLGGIVGAEYRFPATNENENATVRVESGAFYALAAAGWAASEKNVVELGIGGGVELMHVGGSADPSRAVTFTPRTDVVPIVRALARYRFRGPVIGAFAGIGVDVPIADKRYFLLRGSEEIVLFDPWRVRPFLMIGIETP